MTNNRIARNEIYLLLFFCVEGYVQNIRDVVTHLRPLIQQHTTVFLMQKNAVPLLIQWQAAVLLLSPLIHQAT